MEGEYAAEQAAQGDVFGGEGGPQAAADFRLRVIEHNLQAGRLGAGWLPLSGCALRGWQRWPAVSRAGPLRRPGAGRPSRWRAQPARLFAALAPSGLAPSRVALLSPQVIAGYYSRIRLARLAQMLDLGADEVGGVGGVGGVGRGAPR